MGPRLSFFLACQHQSRSKRRMPSPNTVHLQDGNLPPSFSPPWTPLIQSALFTTNILYSFFVLSCLTHPCVPEHCPGELTSRVPLLVGNFCANILRGEPLGSPLRPTLGRTSHTVPQEHLSLHTTQPIVRKTQASPSLDLMSQSTFRHES